jgi:TonB family protein
MAEVRQDRGGILPGSASGGRSVAVLVMALVAVLAAIALIFNASRRSAHQSPPVSSENVEPPAPTPPPAAGPEPSPAASAVPVDDGAASARRQAAIARAIDDGRPALAACYQRALVRDDSLVHGKVTVRASIAPSGRVDSVNVVGPAAFRAMQPCLERAISRWDFPAAPEGYAAEFPLVLVGNQ